MKRDMPQSTDDGRHKCEVQQCDESVAEDCGASVSTSRRCSGERAVLAYSTGCMNITRLLPDYKKQRHALHAYVCAWVWAGEGTYGSWR